MFNLYNWIQDFIYQVIHSENWLFNPINLGVFGFIAPIGLIGVGTLISLLVVYIVRSII